jgi:hypothetical protein
VQHPSVGRLGSSAKGVDARLLYESYPWSDALCSVDTVYIDILPRFVSFIRVSKARRLHLFLRYEDRAKDAVYGYLLALLSFSPLGAQERCSAMSADGCHKPVK